MQNRRCALFFTCMMAVVLLLISCGGKEKKAKNLVLQALPMINNGDWMALNQHLEMIIAEYPKTKAADTARQMQQKMTGQVNRLAEIVLKQAVVAAISCQASYPGEDITLARLRNFGFKPVKGIMVEVDEPEPERFLISAWHSVGDVVWHSGPNGRTWAEEMEE